MRPFSDWLKGQLVVTVFGRCEQHTIDSMVYISLQTREIDRRSTSILHLNEIQLKVLVIILNLTQ